MCIRDSSCAAGAASVTSDQQIISQIKQIGEWIGMAFQIKDDLFDFGDDNIGKPTGIDIKEKKICLLYTSPSPRDRTRSRMPSSA